MRVANQREAQRGACLLCNGNDCDAVLNDQTSDGMPTVVLICQRRHDRMTIGLDHYLDRILPPEHQAVKLALLRYVRGGMEARGRC